MIDVSHLTTQLHQIIEVLEKEAQDLGLKERELVDKQEKIIRDRADLVLEQGVLRQQSGDWTARLEKSDKMYDLSTKMKAQVDEQRAELTTNLEQLDEKILQIEAREEVVKDLEEQKKHLDQIKEQLDERELSLTKREKIVEKDKLAAREKAEDLTYREQALVKKTQRVQRILDQQA